MIESDGKALWLAVIRQAIVDASTPLSQRLGERVDQMQTREWLTIPNRDFEEVCALAGIEPDHVRSVAMPLIEAAKRKDQSRPHPHRSGSGIKQHTPGVVVDQARSSPDRLSRVTQDCA